MKSLLTLGLIAAVAATAAPHLLAQESGDVTAVEAARKVNISGRQRMLSQRMAKAACLMARDISFATTYDQLTQAYTLFQRSDSALRAGDEQMGLGAEGFPEIVNALGQIDQPWSEYSGIVEKTVETGTVEQEDLATLDEDSRDVLKYMNIAVFKIARAYAGAVEQVPLGLTITIDVAGRQRMLTQKAIKEACLMTVSADPSVHADRLNETIELFDLSLKALRDGYEDVGVIAAPTREIDRKLQEVAGLWEPVKSILDRAAEGQVLSDRDLSKVARMSEPLLQTMNEAVGLYEGADRFL
ncbi:MAG: type IV pili methyl-accepting chemotaxis transducer N-terminal domain-containing protein [Geminicoccaceae bacterium]